MVHTAIEPRPEDRWSDARALREALLPFVISRHPASTYGGAASHEGQASAYMPVAKTPRVDGTRPQVKSRRPSTKVDRVASLEIPVEIDRASQVPTTLPPTEGPPRASELPPSFDPAVAPTIRQTEGMKAVVPNAGASPTVSDAGQPQLQQVPQIPRIAGNTVVARRKRGSWIGITVLVVGILGGGAGAGYYYYDQTYNSPVPRRGQCCVIPTPCLLHQSPRSTQKNRLGQP